MARPCATPKRAPTAWASAWLTPTNALAKARPAIVAPLAICVRAARSSPSANARGSASRIMPDRLQAQRVGVRRREDRHVGLERVRQRVDAGVRGERRRHRDRQARLDDRLVRDQRVVDERDLRAADREHGGGRDLRAGAGGGGHGDQPGAVGILREAGDPLARVEERQRELAHGQLGMLGEQAHGLGGVDHRAAADGDDEVGVHRGEALGAGADRRLLRLGLDVREDAHGGRREQAPHLVGHAARLGVGVGHDQHPRGRRLAQRAERAGVEERRRRHAEPLRRRLAAGDDLDVEQLAVVDVRGRLRAAPRAAAERERGRQRVVDAAERADRGRRVDEDAARADRVGEARRRPRRPRRRRPTCGRARRAR